MLPQAVLGLNRSRGGRRAKNLNSTSVVHRGEAWLRGEATALWKEFVAAPDAPPSDTKRDTPSNAHEAVYTAVREGSLSKACRLLRSTPPAVPSAETTKEMSGKHPRETDTVAANIKALTPVSPASAIQVGTDDVQQAILSFQKASAGGPSTLRPEHVQSALRCPGWSMEITRLCTDLVNLFLRGEAPEDVRPFLCGANLTALPKPSGGHRPIAVGEYWRRLTSKVVAAKLGP